MQLLVNFQDVFIETMLQTQKQAEEDGAQLIQAYLLATDKLTTNKQVNIYRSSIHSGLINALSDIYPVCEQVTGESFFYAMSDVYIQSHPSSSPDLADFGDDFSEFIMQFPHTQNMPYLSGVAEIEWAYHRAFHALDEAGFDFVSFSAYSVDELMQCIFLLPASCNFVESNYPVDEIWNMHQTDSVVEMQLQLEPRYFMIFRKGYDIHIDKLTGEQYSFLQSINKNMPFVEVCEEFTETLDASQLLVECLQRGWINKIEIHDSVSRLET